MGCDIACYTSIKCDREPHSVFTVRMEVSWNISELMLIFQLARLAAVNQADITGSKRAAQQHVVIHGELSCSRANNCDVPQGSLPGSLLFNLYINDIVCIDHNAKFMIYADEASLFFPGHNLPEMINNANPALVFFTTVKQCIFTYS